MKQQEEERAAFPPVLEGLAREAEERLKYMEYINQLHAAAYQEALQAERQQQQQQQQQKLQEPEAPKKVESPEFQRISRCIMEATTAPQLLQVLQEEVFERFQDAEKSKNALLAAAPQDGSAKAKPPQTRAQRNKQDTSNQSQIHQIYHDLLLLAAHRFRRTFHTSPLIFTMLPAIKALGMESYALGSSTELYNEIMAATWAQWGECGRIFHMLTEMEESGLKFNGDTHRIVKDVHRCTAETDDDNDDDNDGLAAAVVAPGSVFMVAMNRGYGRQGKESAAYWLNHVERQLEENELTKARKLFF